MSFASADLHPKGFEKWTAIVGSASAQILDVYPILRKLPEFLRPNYRYAKKLHEKELELYRGHWVEAKQRVLEGTSMVGITCLPS